MDRPVTVVTSNLHKFREIRDKLGTFGLVTRRLALTLPEPQASSLGPVVRAKLRSAPPLPGYVVVEDSGIFLAGLDGFPGVYSAYVYDTVGLTGVLRLLKGRDRRARFQTIAGVRFGGRERFFTGEVRGSIAPRPRGREGFGYDPIFVPERERRTLAERSPAEKNRISHRGRAFEKVGRWIVGREQGKGS
jgi:XTP/dITP diphosphohydrolase